MSKATDLKLKRLFIQDENKNVIRREKPILLQNTTKVGDCFICHKPVYASQGQLLTYKVQPFTGKHLYSHKICRKGYQK